MSSESILWVITSYYNPMRYGKRLSNFRLFHKALGLPLLVVELGRDNEFELSDTDGEIVVRRQGDVLWQKERLLNIATQYLPDHVRYVAWIDCDVAFANADWSTKAIDQLSAHKLVQLFDYSAELEPDATSIGDGSAKIVGVGIARHHFGGQASPHEIIRPPLCGLAWAAERELLNNYTIYDKMIVGGGDVGFAFAALGDHMNFPSRTPLGETHFAHYMAWADPFFREVQRSISYVEGTIFHFWHGDRNDRQYRLRHEQLKAHDFDPDTDVALNDDDCLIWSSDKPQLHSYARDYFALRKEDGPIP